MDYIKIPLYLSGENATVDRSNTATIGTAGSYGVYAFEMRKGKNWEGLDIKATFYQKPDNGEATTTPSDNITQVVVIETTDHLIPVPAEILRVETDELNSTLPETWVTFSGYDKGTLKMNSVRLILNISDTGPTVRDGYPDTPDIDDQLIAAIKGYRDNAEEFMNKAENYMGEAEDWAKKAKDHAAHAFNSRTFALESEINAGISESNAHDYMEAAKKSASDAKDSENKAKEYADQAESSFTGSVSKVEELANKATQSAIDANDFAEEAKASAGAALTSLNEAQDAAEAAKTSEINALNSANKASNHEQNAEGFMNRAKVYAESASKSQIEASNVAKEVSANTEVTVQASKEAQSAAKETKTYHDAVVGYATQASGNASAAATSAANAKASETNALNSANQAADSASVANQAAARASTSADAANQSVQQANEIHNKVKEDGQNAINTIGTEKAKAVAEIKEIAAHTPIINDNNDLWQIWDEESGTYKDTDVLARGQGVSTGGQPGQILIKNSVANYDTKWGDLPVSKAYIAEKTDVDKADTDIIEDYFTTNSGVTPNNGDIFVIETKIDEKVIDRSAYYYSGEWIAITGNVDANKVILRDNITLAGDYSQFGNLTKEQSGTVVFNAKGKSVSDVLTEILSKRLQPTITAQPSINGFSLNGAKAVEAGTVIDSVEYTAATLNPGSYSYGPETGVVASNWKIDRVTNSATTEIANVSEASLSTGSDTNDDSGFVIGDSSDSISSLKYKLTVTYGAGVTANDNLGDPSNPSVAIVAGTKSKETSAYTCYRNYFYGATTDKPTIDSNYIRSLTASNKAYAAGTITINVDAGAQRICIACVATATGVTQVINETALGADVTSTFVKSSVDVAGANDYSPVSYNVWTFEPAIPYENAAVLKVTLG